MGLLLLAPASFIILPSSKVLAFFNLALFLIYSLSTDDGFVSIYTHTYVYIHIIYGRLGSGGPFQPQLFYCSLKIEGGLLEQSGRQEGGDF